MRPQDIEAIHDMAVCPACGQTITASMTIKPTLGQPTLAADGKSVDLSVSGELLRFNVAHHCRGRVEAAPVPHPAATDPSDGGGGRG